NLTQCVDEEGEATFDLTTVNNDITTNEAYFFTFYESEQDMEDGVAMDEIFVTDQTQIEKTIWVVAEHEITHCFYVKSFTVRADDCNLFLEFLPDMTHCQEGDEEYLFNLTAYDAVVYNGAVGYTINYFNSEEDAADDTNPIDTALAANYPGVSGETIWVRVTKTDEPARFAVTSFKLYIYDKPAVPTLAPLVSCDNGGVGNFNLQIPANIATGGLTALEVNFYATEALAEEGNPAFILPTSYTGAAVTIYARVTSTVTGCYVIAPLELQLIAPPQTNTLAPLQYCDANNDGFGVFNLEPTKFLVAGNPIPANVLISYHETLADAENNFLAIQNINTYNNIVANQQTIYVRVGYSNSTCYSIEELDLIVNATPEITPVRTLKQCDAGNNNVEFFDLTVVEDMMMDDTTGYTFTYHTTQA